MRNLPENVDSKYRFITIAAKRCELLQRGAKPKIEEDKYNKFTSIAMDEVLNGLIEFEILEEEPEDSEGPQQELPEENGI